MLDRLFSSSLRTVTINVALHLLLGVVSTITKFALIGWFYFILLSGFSILINPKKNFTKYAALLIYLTSYDVISRMAKTSPFIPYELSKYLTVVFALWGLVNILTNGKKYLFMSILLIPAFFIDQLDITGIDDWVNNGIAPINLGLLVALFFRQKVSVETLFVYLRLILYTSLMVLAFAYFKTPDYDKIDFKLSANFTTSGGFGSNQVSTILGLGGFIITVFLLMGRPLTSFRWADIGLLFAFLLQGLLTFSRGGMLGMVLAVGVFVFFASSGVQRNLAIKISKGKMFLYGLLAIIVGFIGFIIADNITGNALSLRYSGETAGTAEGYREKDLNVITSNRVEIYEGDLELWASEPFWGVGVGVSKHERSKLKGVVAHVEFSRLLAEHGLFGLIFFTTWLFLYFKIRKNNQDKVAIAILSALFVLALFTSFHAAIRTNVTPLLTGMAMMSIVIPATRNQKPFNIK